MLGHFSLEETENVSSDCTAGAWLGRELTY